MASPARSSLVIRFGPFELDGSNGVLLKAGIPLKLHPQPFRLLLLLVERRGETVTRKEIQLCLWGGNTLVDPEGGINFCIKQVRAALNDNPKKPRYVETIPRCGYRFVASVTFAEARTQPIPIAPVATPKDLPNQTATSQPSPPIPVLNHVSGVRTGQASEPEPLAQRDLRPLLVAVPYRRWNRRTIAVSLFGGTIAVVAWFWPEAMPKVVRSVQLTYAGRVEPTGPVLADASRIFFAERHGGTRGLAQVAGQGGEPAPISTSIASVALYDIDRRRSRLLVTSQGPNADSYDPLWVLPAGGGSARRVGNVLASDAAWSPDGRQIAYSLFNDLFIVGDDGLQPHKVFTAPGSVEYIRWSPDGLRLSFTLRNISTGTLSLWEIAPDGHDGHPLSFGWKPPINRWGEGECCGDWSPDGRYLVFRATQDGVDSLWIMRQRQGWFRHGLGSLTQLYTSPQSLNEPRFSADGRKVLFASYRERRELVRYDSAKKLFVPYLGGIPARHLSFSRDGLFVAYKNQHDGTLWPSRADATQALQLTFPPLDTYHPTWSPDGTRIVFEGSGRLYTVPFNGGKAQPLLPEGTHDGQPSWSPDGKSLLFAGWTSWEPDGICLMDMSTRRVRMLPGTARFECPRWSPDGKYAAAGNKRDQKLMLFEFKSQNWSALADGTPYGWGLRWSSDSRYVYYQHAYGGEEQPIFRVRISDHRVEQVASSRQIASADVLSYTMTGLTPDNAPLASVVHRNSDVWALELDLP